MLRTLFPATYFCQWHVADVIYGSILVRSRQKSERAEQAGPLPRLTQLGHHGLSHEKVRIYNTCAGYNLTQARVYGVIPGVGRARLSVDLWGAG